MQVNRNRGQRWKFACEIGDKTSKMKDFINLVEPQHTPSMSKRWKPMVPYKQDRMLSPESLKLAVLDSPKIQMLIKRQARTRKEEAELRKSVKEMLDEIGLAMNLPILRSLGTILNKILPQMTAGVWVNDASVKAVKAAISHGRHPVLFLPSHRSYADFVMISYICFGYDLEIPVS